MNIKDGYNNKLKNQLFNCLCAREEDKEWETILDSILIELMGIPENERTINYYIIYYKLSTCRYLSFRYFRKTIFDAMAFISKTGGEGNG